MKNRPAQFRIVSESFFLTFVLSFKFQYGKENGMRNCALGILVPLTSASKKICFFGGVGGISQKDLKPAHNLAEQNHKVQTPLLHFDAT